MGDISAETSMEDILSSIKRIIAEEGDVAATPRAARKAARTPPSPIRADDGDDVRDTAHDSILELNELVDEMAAPARVAPLAREPAMRDPEPQPRPVPLAVAPAVSEAILSDHTAEATRGSLDALTKLIVKPAAAASDGTLEGLVREMLRPMLRDWLDANLPAMVETMVAREIKRITERHG